MPSRKTIIYGHDPLCGWCYGFIPAMKKLEADHPEYDIKVVLGGLITGSRVGPYRDMFSYIKSASVRLRSVTGLAPSDAFYELISSDGVISKSAPPMLAILKVREAAPKMAAAFAHRLQELHFENGLDLNEVSTIKMAAIEVGVTAPVIDDYDQVTEAHPDLRTEIAAAHELGLASFPTVYIADGAMVTALPTEYDPAAFVKLVEQHM